MKGYYSRLFSLKTNRNSNHRRNREVNGLQMDWIRFFFKSYSMRVFMACNLIKSWIVESIAYCRLNFKMIFSHSCQNAGKWSKIKSTPVWGHAIHLLIFINVLFLSACFIDSFKLATTQEYYTNEGFRRVFSVEVAKLGRDLLFISLI